MTLFVIGVVGQVHHDHVLWRLFRSFILQSVYTQSVTLTPAGTLYCNVGRRLTALRSQWWVPTITSEEYKNFIFRFWSDLNAENWVSIFPRNASALTGFERGDVSQKSTVEMRFCVQTRLLGHAGPQSPAHKMYAPLPPFARCRHMAVNVDKAKCL
jgi:hypothetical protein